MKYASKGEKFKGFVLDSYTVDKRKLNDPTSALYCYLFDTQCAREIGSLYGSGTNPFYQTSIIDFLTANRETEIHVFIWPPVPDYQVASIVFSKPSSRQDLGRIMQEGWPSNGWPLEKWGKEFVACDFNYTEYGWRYYAGIFKVAVDD